MFRVVRRLSRIPPDACPLYFSRVTMASGRNHYIKGGSNKQDISPETKKLIKEARDPEDFSWQLGPGIQEPLEVDLTTEERTRALQYKVKYKGHRVMGGEDRGGETKSVAGYLCVCFCVCVCGGGGRRG